MRLEEIMEMKEKLEEAKTKQARAEGALKSTLQQLKDDFGCSSVEDIDKEIKKIEKKKAQLEEELEELAEELEEVFG